MGVCRFSTTLSMILICLAFGVSAGDMRLAVRGAAPEYTIVVPAATPSSVHASAASPSLDYAAAELADFIERQTGVRRDGYGEVFVS